MITVNEMGSFWREIVAAAVSGLSAYSGPGGAGMTPEIVAKQAVFTADAVMKIVRERREKEMAR